MLVLGQEKHHNNFLLHMHVVKYLYVCVNVCMLGDRHENRGKTVSIFRMEI